MNSSAAHPSTQRALAAIVLTDAVSFSARMSVDEEGTLALIQRDLQLMGTACNHFGGQVLKSTGDGLLMSFASAVQAVRCGQDIQTQLADLAEGLLPQEYLQHRIGIHLGDVLFSHGDVLGNGVNIAARLQTKSIPGGICISQTVYDVVKARLHFEATFLGPLKLKNIKEPVPAFQIPPAGQPATMLVQRSSPTEGEASKTPLLKAAQDLQADPQNQRIKKLIFGICHGVWENDPISLLQVELASLLEQLCQRYQTLAALDAALKAMASRLNRKAEYLAVADRILQVLQPVYAHHGHQAPATIEDSTILAETGPNYPAIAAALNHEPDPLRIKKLLYGVIHTAWENNPAVLEQQSMEALVTEVHQIAPSESDLNYHLARIIKRLNQQSRYMQIALAIAEAFQPLYSNHQVVAAQAHGTVLETAATEPTSMGSEGTPTSDSPTITHFKREHPQSEEPTITRLNVSSSEVLPPQVQPTCRDRVSLFNLRMEIMRYTNPLRAKILLLSTVRGPFAFSQQDWIALKSKTLDDLVQDVFDYCQTYADLESKLVIMSHCVGNAEESTQTAGAILQAMKPFYPILESSPCPP